MHTAGAHSSPMHYDIYALRGGHLAVKMNFVLLSNLCSMRFMTKS
jgi:hypothetical protein